MADAAPLSSIKARISALNLEQVGATPGTPPPYTYEVPVAKTSRPPPPPPPSKRPPNANRSVTTNNPPIHSIGASSETSIGNKPIGPGTSATLASKEPPQLPARPSLPPRPSHNGSKPTLPPRRPSEQSLVSRKTSNESISSVTSARTTNSAISSRTSFSTNGGAKEEMYRIKAPVFDLAALPPLPPKREKTDEGLRNGRGALRPARSTSASSTPRVIAPPPDRHVKAPIPERNHTLPAKTTPPTLPDRPALPNRPNTVKEDASRAAKIKRSALSYGMNKDTETPPLPSMRPGEVSSVSEHDSSDGGPPPVPLSSRPDLSAILSMKPKPGTQAANSCLKCRDFSGPDSHAARFPRQSIPSTDIAWLAHQLTSPFPSATDKARVLFTWLHHNIAYDVNAFFNSGIRHVTPADTIAHGAAVCSGYAGIFTALATHAGLESVVVGGDGKGFGYTPLKPGEPVPPYKSNHAWNAVKIDNGEWKLIDSCWGAGNVGTDQRYTKHFKPNMFVCDNIEFGLTHFPENNSHFYRPDGRIMTWEEYMLDDVGERVTVYTDSIEVHGFGRTTFSPQQLHIRVHAPGEPGSVRFRFGYKCPHWSSERHGQGKPYVMLLKIGGRDGRKEDKIPFNTDGRMWWVDIARQDLGCPGQQVNVWMVTTFGGRDGRGISVQEYKEKKGKVGMSFASVCHWALV